MTNLLFILFLILYIQMPGLLILKSKKQEEIGISLERILIAFNFGLGLLILEYIFLSWIGLRIMFLLIGPILSAIFLYRKTKEKKSLKPTVKCVGVQFAVIVIIISILTCLTQRYAFLNPEDYNSIYLYQDITWHIGNVASLSKGYPFFDFRFAGLKFNYHYFNNLIFGMCKYCFGINAAELFLKCTPVLTIYTFSLGIYSFFKRVSSKPLLGLVMIICSGSTITYWILNTNERESLLNYHIFSNINAVAVSLAALIGVFLFFSELYQKSNTELKDILVLSVLVFVATGFKGPFTAVLLPAMVITTIMKAAYDRNIKRMVTISMAAGLSFIFTYIVIIKGVENIASQSNNNRATELSIAKTFSKTRLWENFSSLLDYGDIGHKLVFCFCVALIGSAIAAGVYFIFFAGISLKTLWEMLKCKKDISTEVLLSITSGWIGLAAFWLISHTGFSQAYFLFAAVLFIVFAALHLIDTEAKKHAKALFTVIVIVNTAVWGYYYATKLVDSLRYDGHFKVSKSDDTIIEVQDLTHNELLGLEWIRNNTDKDCIIATDRIDLWNSEYPERDRDCRCFYYSAFAERQMYIEGYSYSDIAADAVADRLANNKRIFSTDPGIARKAAENAKVDYVVVSKRINDTTTVFGEPIYSNPDISIYDTSKGI